MYTVQFAIILHSFNSITLFMYKTLKHKKMSLKLLRICNYTSENFDTKMTTTKLKTTLFDKFCNKDAALLVDIDCDVLSVLGTSKVPRLIRVLVPTKVTGSVFAKVRLS